MFCLSFEINKKLISLNIKKNVQQVKSYKPNNCSDDQINKHFFFIYKRCACL